MIPYSNFPLTPSLSSKKRQSNFFRTLSYYFLSYFQGPHKKSTEMSDNTGRRQNQRQGTSKPKLQTQKPRPSPSQPKTTKRYDPRQLEKSQPPPSQRKTTRKDDPGKIETSQPPPFQPKTTRRDDPGKIEKSQPPTSQPKTTRRDEPGNIEMSQPSPPLSPPAVPEPVILPISRWKYVHSRMTEADYSPDASDVDARNEALLSLLQKIPKPKTDPRSIGIHISKTPEVPPSVKLPTRPTLPGKEEGAMGNQGIRQHVETSTKTGVFHLSKAKLHEFPPELAKIVNALRSIDLSENRIVLIPQNISAFVNLKHLNLNSNQIEVIPDQIGQLTKLETLSLANNRIKSVPGTIAHLQKLRDANLSSNTLSTFPVVFSSLKYLTVLDLARNRIPEVPAGVGGLQVVELILNQNQVRIVSKELALCPNLKTLRLQENTLELSGLPTEILSDSLISLLSLEGNLFDVKQLSDLEGYEKYMDRYTSTKKKLT